MTSRVQPRRAPTVDRHPDGLPDDALEASRLLLELVHVAYATRSADTRTGESRSGTGSAMAPPERDARPAPSIHAVRAAIHIYQHGGRTIGELAGGLGISYGWASRVVSELEAASMVRRLADADDRRVVRVSLTPDAIAMVEEAYRWRGAAVERALAPLDAIERRVVMAFLRRVTDELAEAGRRRLPQVQ